MPTPTAVEHYLLTVEVITTLNYIKGIKERISVSVSQWHGCDNVEE
jgi:hypothetical protein